MNPEEEYKATLLFRCVGNIELGLMAKGLLEGIADQYFDIEAAGDQPAEQGKFRIVWLQKGRAGAALAFCGGPRRGVLKAASPNSRLAIPVIRRKR